MGIWPHAVAILPASKLSQTNQFNTSGDAVDTRMAGNLNYDDRHTDRAAPEVHFQLANSASNKTAEAPEAGTTIETAAALAPW